MAGVKGAPTFIKLGAAYPNQLVTIVIWQNVREKLGNDPAEAKCATGRISVYEARPHVVVTNPAKLGIVYDEEVKLSELPWIKTAGHRRLFFHQLYQLECR